VSLTVAFLHRYSLYVSVMLVMLVLGLCQPWSSQYFQFDRVAIASGEVWRLFSASWVHLSTNHLLGNLAGMALVAYIAGSYLNNRLGIALLFWSTAFVGIGLYLWADNLQRYVGMSGALHGLLLVAPFVSGFYSRRMAWVFFVVIVTKTLWEQTPWYDDMALFGYIGGRVETRSHLLGMIAGVLFLMALKYFRQQTLPADSKKESADE